MLKTGRRPCANRPDGKELVKEYETHTAKELSEKYSVSITTIRRWIREERTITENDENTDNREETKND